MPIRDIYETRTQLKAIELLENPYSFLFDTFAADAGAVEDDKAIYDFRKGSRQMAPIVHRGTGGVLMSRDGFETKEIGFCQIAPERIVTNPDINKRGFGENVLGALTPQQRAKKLFAKDIVDMRAAIQRRREWMVRQVLSTGRLDVFRYTSEGRDKETTLVADYQFTNQYIPAVTWDSSGAKINDDMCRMLDIVQNGLGYVDVIVMDTDSAQAMLSNSDYILKNLDIRNMDMGRINTRYVGQGVRFLGWNSDGIEMYSFAGTFIDDDRKPKPQLPRGTVIAGSKGMLKCPHGAVTQVESVGTNAEPRTYIKKEVPLRYGSVENNSVKNRLTSCPTIVPYNVDGWCRAAVL